MKIITLTGCGGIGKDSILNGLIKRDNQLIPIISTTSRPPRQGEINGQDYNFVGAKQAESMLNNNTFIEHRTYDVINSKGKNETWIYGITKDSIDLYSNNTYIVIVDYEGRKSLQKYLKDNQCENSLISIYIDGSYQTRLTRYLNREEMTNSKVLEAIRRFEDDNINVLPAKYDSDYVVKNEEKLENAIDRILDIIEEYK